MGEGGGGVGGGRGRSKRKVPEGSLSSNRKGAKSGKTPKKIVAVSQGSRSSEHSAVLLVDVITERETFFLGFAKHVGKNPRKKINQFVFPDVNNPCQCWKCARNGRIM